MGSIILYPVTWYNSLGSIIRWIGDLILYNNITMLIIDYPFIIYFCQNFEFQWSFKIFIYIAKE